MPARLPKANSDTNAWIAFNNYMKTYNQTGEYINVVANANNPPTVKQYSRFSVYKTDTDTIPSSPATGNSEYAAGDVIQYQVDEAIFEPSDQTFAWGAGGFPAISDGTWYLYSTGSLDTSSATIGKGAYNASKNAPTFNFDKGGWYSTDGKVIAKFTVTASVVSNVISMGRNFIYGESTTSNYPTIIPGKKGQLWASSGDMTFLSNGTSSLLDWSIISNGYLRGTTITSSQTVDNNDRYSVYFSDTSAGDHTITLGTASTFPGKIVHVKQSSTGGRTTVTSGGTIDGKTNIYIDCFNCYLTLINNGVNNWSILSYKNTIDTGWISCSKWDDRILGSVEIDYDARSSAGADHFTSGEVVTGGTSGATGIIMLDTDLATTGTLTLKLVTSGGIFTNNETITGGTSGTTALVNEVTGNNKNKDTNLYHGTGLNTDRYNVKTLVGASANYNFSVLLTTLLAGTGENKGIFNYQTSTDKTAFYTGTSGIQYLDLTGADVNLLAQDWYFRMIWDTNGV